MCFWHGHPCQPFLDLVTMSSDNLAARYEQTISRLEQISRAGHQFKVQWVCEFDVASTEIPEILADTAVSKSPLCTRGPLYGRRKVAELLHYKARECETIQYLDGMSFFPYICKCFKFLMAIPSSMWETFAMIRKHACVWMA